MMKRKARWRIWAVICVLTIVLMVVYAYGISTESPQKPENYSVVLYEHTDNEWETLADGMSQAEKDLNIKVNYVYMGREDTASDQAAAIQKEIDAGSAGILVAASDSEALRKELGGMSFSVPLLFVETGAGNEYPVVRTDDYQMGYELGEALLQDIKKRQDDHRVAVICEYMERDSVRLRYEGLVDALKKDSSDIETETFTRGSGDYSLSLFIGTLFSKCGSYIVALDKYATQEAAAAWLSEKSNYEKNGREVLIYGIGNTGQTVNALDNENRHMLAYQNEFKMGYEGLQCLVDRRSKNWVDNNVEIRHKLVTKDTLYEYENERLLFPNT